MKMKKRRIGATMVTRNCESQDYCFVESIESLAPIADEIIICDVESSDGTIDVLSKMRSGFINPV